MLLYWMKRWEYPLGKRKGNLTDCVNRLGTPSFLELSVLRPASFGPASHQWRYAGRALSGDGDVAEAVGSPQENAVMD